MSEPIRVAVADDHPLFRAGVVMSLHEEDGVVVVGDAADGATALALPSDEGLDRALWAVPVTAMVFAVGFIVVLGRRWQRRGS